MKIGALEAGGTKTVCAVGDETGKIFERISIPTEMPEITVPRLIEYFKDKEIDALGIGCFGPIDLNRSSETYGYITTTPKLAWRYLTWWGHLKKHSMDCRWDLIRMSMDPPLVRRHGESPKGWKTVFILP